MLKENGNESGAKLLDIIVDEKSSNNLLQQFKRGNEKLSATDSVALVSNANLTQHEFNVVKSTLKSANRNVIPSYRQVNLLVYTFLLVYYLIFKL